MLATPLQPSDMIGVAAAVRGTVELSREGVVGKKIGSGENIYLGDKITTDAKGRLQILLLDETVFTIGPNSAMAIDTFVYDPKTDNGEVKAKIVKGTFRFVTGKIGHKKPSQMRVDLPAGSIGIRGTIVAGQTEGMHSFVMLLGPGEGNNTGNNAGAFTLSNNVNGQIQEVEVNRSGYGSVIEGNGVPPAPVFQVPQDQINAIISSLSSPPGNPSGGGDNDASPNTPGNIGSASDVSGENTIAALSNANDFESLTESINHLTTESSPASQNTLPPPSGSNSSDSGGGVVVVDTTFNYSASNISLTTQYWTGTYSFNLDINQTDQTINGLIRSDAICVYDDGIPNGDPQLGFSYTITKTFASLQNDTILALGAGDITDMDISELPTGHDNTGSLTITFSDNPATTRPETVNYTLTVNTSNGIVTETANVPVTAE